MKRSLFWLSLRGALPGRLKALRVHVDHGEPLAAGRHGLLRCGPEPHALGLRGARVPHPKARICATGHRPVTDVSEERTFALVR